MVQIVQFYATEFSNGCAVVKCTIYRKGIQKSCLEGWIILTPMSFLFFANQNETFIGVSNKCFLSTNIKDHSVKVLPTIKESRLRWNLRIHLLHYSAILYVIPMTQHFLVTVEDLNQISNHRSSKPVQLIIMYSSLRTISFMSKYNHNKFVCDIYYSVIIK